MSELEPVSSPARILPRAGLERLIAYLRQRGFRVLGPMLRESAIAYGEVRGDTDLPTGWTDTQQPGKYRLVRREDERVFGYAVGPHSWRQFFHVPVQRLFTACKEDGRLRFVPEPVGEEPLAVLGARSCDLAALETQDAVLRSGIGADPHYVARRENAFIAAVNCSVASASCFCTSMGTGPQATRGFDLGLTELLDADGHRFLVEIKSRRGLEVADALELSPASQSDIASARGEIAETAASITRQMNTAKLREVLLANLEHKRWDDIAARCLSCSNCTDVCPTCFCTSTEDSTDLSGDVSARVRKWDSCFTESITYLHGGAVRAGTRARYRQWLTHKLATWHDQFGRSGCVGCGRCITWCPVGIDITEEVRALREPATGTEG